MRGAEIDRGKEGNGQRAGRLMIQSQESNHSIKIMLKRWVYEMEKGSHYWKNAIFMMMEEMLLLFTIHDGYRILHEEKTLKY